LVGVGIAVGVWSLHSGRRRGTSLYLAVLSVAAVYPLASTSADSVIRADLACFASLLVMMAFSRAGVWQPVGWLLIAVACALDATALLLVLGFLMAALADRRQVALALVLLVLGAVVVLAVAWSGYAVMPLESGYMSVHRRHWDLQILLPIVLVGATGWFRYRHREGLPSIAITLAGTAGLLLVALGLRLNVRICALPVLFWLPQGLQDLRILLSAEPPSRLARVVGGACVAVLAMLSWPAFASWYGHLLQAIHPLVP
jgi:hypothetical protein